MPIGYLSMECDQIDEIFHSLRSIYLHLGIATENGNMTKKKLKNH